MFYNLWARLLIRQLKYNTEISAIDYLSHCAIKGCVKHKGFLTGPVGAQDILGVFHRVHKNNHLQHTQNFNIIPIITHEHDKIAMIVVKTYIKICIPVVIYFKHKLTFILHKTPYNREMPIKYAYSIAEQYMSLSECTVNQTKSLKNYHMFIIFCIDCTCKTRGPMVL